MTPRSMGYATLAVLRALAEGHRYGFEIVDHTGLATGTVYPALSNLEGRGFAASHWENEDVAHSDGRPRRRYYEVTREGRAALESSIARLGALGLTHPSSGPEPV